MNTNEFSIILEFIMNMNYKNIISALFIAIIFAGGVSCTNKTKSAKQGNDSIAAYSVVATDNEEPVDVVKCITGNYTMTTTF